MNNSPIGKVGEECTPILVIGRPHNIDGQSKISDTYLISFIEMA